MKIEIENPETEKFNKFMKNYTFIPDVFFSEKNKIRGFMLLYHVIPDCHVA
jgi:hypothetical protein